MSTSVLAQLLATVKRKNSQGDNTTITSALKHPHPTITTRPVAVSVDPPPPPFSPQSISTSTSIIHLEYDPASLPHVPSPLWTRFVCISDTHTRSFDVPDGDVLLHSGDLTNLGTPEDFQTTMDWLVSLPHKVKIIIAGNHDLTLDTEWYEAKYPRFHSRIGKQDAAQCRNLLTDKRALEAGIVYLQDASHTFQVKPNGRTWSVYGSPWSPYFFGWAFNYPREEGKELVAKFPKTDILLTHGPPSGIFDVTRGGQLAGCEDLRERLPELRPRLHVFGHIHEARGACIHSWASDPEPPVVQNAYDEADSAEADSADEDECIMDVAEAACEAASQAAAAPGVPSVDGKDGGTGEETVFVNAATSPSGRGLWRGTYKVPFGGTSFLPWQCRAVPCNREVPCSTVHTLPCNNLSA